MLPAMTFGGGAGIAGTVVGKTAAGTDLTMTFGGGVGMVSDVAAGHAAAGTGMRAVAVAGVTTRGGGGGTST
eukprot:3059392-Amphidinium_carterae.1